MITTGGIHKETVVGNPLDDKSAKVIAVIPKATYFLLESLSEERANFHSFIPVPGEPKVRVPKQRKRVQTAVALMPSDIISGLGCVRNHCTIFPSSFLIFSISAKYP